LTRVFSRGRNAFPHFVGWYDKRRDAARSVSQTPAPLSCPASDSIISAVRRTRNYARDDQRPSAGLARLPKAGAQNSQCRPARMPRLTGRSGCAALSGAKVTNRPEKGACNWRVFHSFPKMNRWYSLLCFLVVVRLSHQVEAGGRGSGRELPRGARWRCWFLRALAS